MKDISSPAIFGPGAWLIMHFLSLICLTTHLKNLLSVILMLYLYNLTCSVCQEHALEFLSKNPISEIKDFFKWTVDFHNHANIKTGKKTVTYEEAQKLVFENFENPKLVDKFGPGIWIFISVVCKNARSVYEKVCVVEILSHLMRELLNLSIDHWKYCQEFFDFSLLNKLKKSTHPTANSLELFKWSFEFHNIVSKKLSKKTESFETILDMYSSVCSHNCGAS